MVTDRMIGDELLEAAVRATDDARFDPTAWRPSLLGHPCDRYLVLKRTGTPERPPDRRDLAYFRRGRIVEDWVVSLYRRRWPRITRRQFPVAIPVNQDLILTGHVDLWIPPARLAVEVKSVSPSVMESGPLPRLDDLLQVRLYLDALSRHFGRNDLRAELVYVSLGRELAWRVFPVYPNAFQVAQARARVVMLEAMARAGEVPEVPFWPDQYPCSWRDGEEVRTCPFFAHCHAGGQGERLEDGAVTAERAGELAEAWLAAKAAERAHQQAYEQARELRRAIEEREIVPMARSFGAERIVDPSGHRTVSVRWHPGRVTYDVEAAIACGAVEEAALRPFRREGKGWWEVRVTCTPRTRA